MNRMWVLKVILLFGIFMSLASCTHSVHIVNFSDFRPYREAKTAVSIEAKSEQFVVLGFTDNTSYVNEAYQRLMQKCIDGQISGISTQYYTSLGFFSWTNHIVMQGLCHKVN
ncbi:MAG: hypothetical protein L6Q37_03420 [Bdellovibrionaceae bacterium]|nr:hypothetical protein [Pseudobdellovibrionaceae bacterium]NUM59745.1 hypothetical protein [Pseudobdellovibrionaceae bacterium]